MSARTWQDARGPDVLINKGDAYYQVFSIEPATTFCMILLMLNAYLQRQAGTLETCQQSQ